MIDHIKFIERCLLSKARKDGKAMARLGTANDRVRDGVLYRAEMSRQCLAMLSAVSVDPIVMARALGWQPPLVVRGRLDEAAAEWLAQNTPKEKR